VDGITYLRQLSTAIIFLLLLVPSATLFVDAGSRSTANLCRNCHGESYGDYVALSQFSVPAEVEIGEVFNVSVRMVLSGNIDQNIPDYWRVDIDVTLSSTQNQFTFSPATYSYYDKLPGDVIDISWQLTADQGAGPDTLFASVQAVAQHFGRSGNDQLSSGIEVVAPNTNPQLSQAAFSPTQGGVNQLFDFEVVWSDADGDMPTNLHMVVDGSPHLLSEAFPGVEDPETGVTFISSSLTLTLGDHTYFFQGSDGEADVRLPNVDEEIQSPSGPLTGLYPGPFVGLAPILENASVSPLVGDATTNFTYSITLPVCDEMNSTQVTLWLNGMAFSGQPTVTDLGGTGWHFAFKTPLVAGVTNFHYFTATNSFGSFRYPEGTESQTGPVVVGDVLSAASLLPTQGDEQTLYRLSINYSNPASIAPDFVAVVIDGTSVLLNSTSANPDWINSTLFTVETLLAVGNHSYHFEAVEGGRSHRVPANGELLMEVARINSAPWLAESQIIVDSVEVFNQSSMSNNDEVANVSRPTYFTGVEIEVRITFYDNEGDEPLAGTLIAWIDGTPILLERLDSNNSTEGQVWGINITLLQAGVNHTVYFTATSAYIPNGFLQGEMLRFPISENMTLPLPDIVEPTPPNVPPVLKPPSDGRLMLDPFAGTKSDTYTFLIEVVDGDWAPEIHLQVWLELDGEIHHLQPVEPIDHRNGTVYGITLQLSEGEHLHKFRVNDTEDDATYPKSEIINGPIVQANMISIDDLRNKEAFVSWAWWFVVPNLLLICGGIGWATNTFIQARRVVNQREVRKYLNAAKEVDEKVEQEQMISQNEVVVEEGRNKPQKSCYADILENLLDDFDY